MIIVLSSYPAMTGVDFRLAAGAIRELHWHDVAEVNVLLLVLCFLMFNKYFPSR